MPNAATKLTRQRRKLPGVRMFVLVAAGAAAIYGAYKGRVDHRPIEQRLEPSPVVEIEGLILKLGPRLNESIGRSVQNLRLPDPLRAELFAEQVEVVGLAQDADPVTDHEFPTVGIRKLKWPIASRSEVRSRSELNLWARMFETVTWFERASFSIVRANYHADSSDLLDMLVWFEGVARTSDGGTAAVKGVQSLTWRKSAAVAADDDRNSWTISAWRQEKLDFMVRQSTLFEDSLDTAIPDRQLRDRLRTSMHEKLILAKFDAMTSSGNGSGDFASEDSSDWEPPHQWFTHVSQDRHPGLAVVDIDSDGFDDLYVMARWGRNVLLRNRGDGTFEDIAPEIGLDIDGACSSAVFADFDNDGDPDVVIGRTLVPSLYLINDEGRFVDRTDSLVGGWLPSLVSSVSAADYNGDGLLDVFFATYAAHTLRDQLDDRSEAGKPLLRHFLVADELIEFNVRVNTAGYHRYFNNVGPPNRLMENKGGGRFERSEHNAGLQLWRHSYQASWSDYDADGDPDLYVANDFATNNLYRNDGDAGFVDVAEETGTTDIGFGMGAAWGDYDNDGRQDLYVSNMFSKAGRRITGGLQEIDSRFSRMARGNSLFRNLSDGFEKVSGLEPPALQVEKAGWAWAGQFVDFDNDGFLDIHALSGYYTAPSRVAVKVDL